MKTIIFIIIAIIITIKGLSVGFDSMSNEMSNDAQNRLATIEQVAN